MRRAVLLPVSFAVAIFAMTSTGAPGPGSEAVDQAYMSGETLDYNLGWMRITGGVARMTIGPMEGDPPRYRITSLAKSTPGFSRIFKVRDEIETHVRRSDFATLRYVKRLDEKGDRIEEVTVVEDGVATRTRKKVKKVKVPEPVFDPISVIYHFRRFDLAPGRTYDLTLIADGKVYEVHARVVRREKVETPAGTFQALLVEPSMKSGGREREEKLYIWYSDDERRLPVRIRSHIAVGSITANLTRVTGAVLPAEP